MENNWIENSLGKCPVANGTVVDVKYRDGNTEYGLVAGYEEGPARYKAGEYYWVLDGMDLDIMYWRLHKPEQSLDDALGSTTVPLVGAFKPPPEYVYPQTSFKPSSEAQLRADEAARVNNILSEKLSTISDTVNKLTGKNFSVADIKLVKDFLDSVEEYEENK